MVDVWEGLREPAVVSNNGKGASVICSGKVSGMAVADKAGELVLLFIFSEERLLVPSFIRNLYSDKET